MKSFCSVPEVGQYIPMIPGNAARHFDLKPIECPSRVLPLAYKYDMIEALSYIS